MVYNILIASEILRILLTILILYSFDIPIFIKIFFISIIDFIDCSPKGLGTGPLFTKNTKICNTIYYQKIDKITDSICYVILLFYIMKHGNLPYQYNYVLIFLLGYRLLGVIIFLLNSERKYLIYFPNFFLLVSLVLMFINYFSMLKKFIVPISFLTFIIQILIEISLHKMPLRELIKKI